MSTFREIDEKLLQLVDEEGEILDVSAFEALQMEREQKAQNMALWILDLRDEQEALQREIERLKARYRSALYKEHQLMNYLAIVLNGEKLKTDKVSVSYRTTEAVEITDEETLLRLAAENGPVSSIVRYGKPEISKSEVKRLIQSGMTLPGAQLVKRTALQVR